MSNRAERRRGAHLAKKYKPMLAAESARHERLRDGQRAPRILHVREGVPRKGALGTPERPFACIRDASAVSKAGDQIYVSGVYTQNETVTLPIGVVVRGSVFGEVETMGDTKAVTAEAIAKLAALQKGPGAIAAANEAPPVPPPEESAPPQATIEKSPQAAREKHTRLEEPAAAGPSNPFLGLADAIAAGIGAKK